MFYDANMDLNKLFADANAGDIDAMIQCVSYISSMGEDAGNVFNDIRAKYIDELVREEVPAGLIWKAENLLAESLKQESVKAAMSCYYLAALNGDYFGVECIGDMYYEGKGVDADWRVAKNIFWAAINLLDGVERVPSSISKCACPHYRMIEFGNNFVMGTGTFFEDIPLNLKGKALADKVNYYHNLIEPNYTGRGRHHVTKKEIKAMIIEKISN